MKSRVLIIGGYGNFGRFIAQRLVRYSEIQVIVAGRRIVKAQQLARQLQAANPIETASLDIFQDLSQSLKELHPQIVIHTSGPYQSQGYDVARACIAQGCHYIDLADARDFVCNIHTLNQQASENRVLVCSGASSVPTLTSAIIDHYLKEFQHLDSLDYAIATAQLTNRGLATTSAVLSYAGRCFPHLINGQSEEIYGWLNLRFRKFWGLGNRPLGNCDIPDLDLFPQRYPGLRNHRFQAGLESSFLHLTLVGLSWLVRLKILPSLQPLAPYLLKLSRPFDIFGRDDSGFFMEMKGKDQAGETKQILFEILARAGAGPYIPCIPAILMTLKLARGEVDAIGAHPCMGFIRLEEYLDALGELNIQWRESSSAKFPRF